MEKTRKTKEKKECRIHIVAKGDTLHGIAAKYLGNTARYAEIKKLNNLPNDIIRIGQKLKIPER